MYVPFGELVGIISLSFLHGTQLLKGKTMRHLVAVPQGAAFDGTGILVWLHDSSYGVGEDKSLA